MKYFVYRISSCREKHAISTLNVNYKYSKIKTKKIK